MPDRNFKYEKAQTLAENFLKENNYDSFSTPEIMQKIFDLALKAYLISEDDLDLWVLGVIAEEFDANPSIHLVDEKYKTAIYEAMELVYELLHEKNIELAETMVKLKEFSR